MNDDDFPESDHLAWHDGDMPYCPRFGDHFYSVHDGRAECRHVFLAGNDLPQRWSGRDRFVIGELGFGTGLNLLETWALWRRNARRPMLDFVTFEKYPLSAADMRRAHARWPELRKDSEALLAHWPPAPDTKQTIIMTLESGFRLTVHIGDAAETLHRLAPMHDAAVDAWFLDGFAPSRNPGLWQADLLKQLASISAADATFATYTVAGWVRRNLQAAGFIVEKAPGHAGKRQMLRGRLACRPEGCEPL
jgi:tRNA U34 5-methylaminomethyl-2-thiouridine-forming methyltransferase MnmC